MSGLFIAATAPASTTGIPSLAEGAATLGALLVLAVISGTLAALHDLRQDRREQQRGESADA